MVTKLAEIIALLVVSFFVFSAFLNILSQAISTSLLNDCHISLAYAFNGYEVETKGLFELANHKSRFGYGESQTSIQTLLRIHITKRSFLFFRTIQMALWDEYYSGI